jgi:hypothetical protein
MYLQRGDGAMPPAVGPEGHKDLYEKILERVHALGTQSLRGLWRLRARFPADLAEAVDCLEQARHDPPHGASVPNRDRRGAPRFPAQRATVLVAEDRLPYSHADGVLLDWSWRGMRILAHGAHDVGTVLRIVSSAREPTVSVTVCSCVRCEDGWALGCERIGVS